VETHTYVDLSLDSQFLENIAPGQIWFRQSGSNLEVSIIGTPDKLTIQNWYDGGASSSSAPPTARP
jgi:hypothetical protein